MKSSEQVPIGTAHSYKTKETTQRNTVSNVKWWNTNIGTSVSLSGLIMYNTSLCYMQWISVNLKLLRIGNNWKTDDVIKVISASSWGVCWFFVTNQSHDVKPWIQSFWKRQINVALLVLFNTCTAVTAAQRSKVKDTLTSQKHFFACNSRI